MTLSQLYVKCKYFFKKVDIFLNAAVFIGLKY